VNAARARKLTSRAARAHFVVLTGQSGAGKSQAIRAMEDLGYYCVDNLPVALLPVLANLSQREDADNPKVAVVVDVREKRFLTEFPRVYRTLLKIPGLHPALIFLEASDAALLRRFSETRRPHPFAPDLPVADAVRDERARLSKIRALADETVDTSDLTVHELRQLFLAVSSGRQKRARMVLTFESFGFKHGLPLDADLVFDARFLPNPHYVPGLRPKTGRDAAVKAYLGRQPATRQFAKRLVAFLRFLVPQYVAEGKSYLTVAIGCTGGRHRSVYLAELLKREFTGATSVSTRARHRDAGKESLA
jgi:RNase adapter protein RapZ